MSSIYVPPDQVFGTTRFTTGLDPIAQSFVVDTPGGAFVTSLDLYFASISTTDSVTVQIRTMENGIPSGVIVPFSTVTLTPDLVNFSTNAAISTTFTFESPIYLLNNTEYCFIVTSKSRDYKLWVAELGGSDVTNPLFSITKQPYSGVMFMSQNASTWVPELTKDIKFSMRRAQFATSGTLVMNEGTIPPVTLASNPIRTYGTTLTITSVASTGTTTVTATVASTTGISVGDLVTISGATGTEQSKLNGSWTVASIPNGTTFTFTVTTAPASGTYSTNLGTCVKGSKVVRIYHPDHGHFAGVSSVTIAGVPSAVNGVPAASLNKTFTVQTIEQDSYTILVDTFSSAAGLGGGSAVTATENRMFDTMYPIVQQVSLKETTSNWYVRTTSGRSLAGSETPGVLSDYSQIPVNANVNMTNPQAVIGVSGSKTFFLKGEFSTSNTALSPVVDLNRVSVVTVNNRLNDPASAASTGHDLVETYIPETSAVGCSALSRYLTRRIDLANPAAAIRLYFTANTPAGSSIKTYFKVLPKGSDQDFDSIGWTLVDPLSSIPITDDPTQYTEVEYDVTESVLSNVEFTSFAIKIVLLSSDSSAVPTVRELRAIAVT